MREVAGLSLDEVRRAVDLRDPELLALAEHGKMALPFELILRLAAVLARNDPVPFVMNLTKVYSPTLWTALDSLGVGRLVEQAGREHDFVGISRARDHARQLTDGEFRSVCGFVEAAFDLALELVVQPRCCRQLPPPHRKPTSHGLNIGGERASAQARPTLWRGGAAISRWRGAGYSGLRAWAKSTQARHRSTWPRPWHRRRPARVGTTGKPCRNNVPSAGRDRRP